MRINKEKMNVALADNEMSANQIESVGQTTVYRAMNGKNISTKSVGRIANELGVNVADIVETEERK